MKVGIDSYCYHRFFGEVYGPLGEPNRRMTYADFLRRAAELKVDGVSLETCFFESLDDAYLKGLKEIIDAGGMEPVIAWGHPKGFEGGKAPQAMADLQKMYRVCHILGAKVMRVVGSSLDYRNDPHEPQLQALTGIFKEAARVAEGEGVKLAMENHFDFTTDEFMDLVDRVDSPYFGVCFDTGNALRIGDDPVESARLLGQAHLRDAHQGCQAGLRRQPQGVVFLRLRPGGARCDQHAWPGGCPAGDRLPGAVRDRAGLRAS